MNWRPAQTESKGSPLQAEAPRRHAWPFISRYADKPATAQPARKSSEHGS